MLKVILNISITILLFAACGASISSNNKNSNVTDTSFVETKKEAIIEVKKDTVKPDSVF
jgi:hypothetical protein